MIKNLLYFIVGATLTAAAASSEVDKLELAFVRDGRPVSHSAVMVPPSTPLFNVCLMMPSPDDLIPVLYDLRKKSTPYDVGKRGLGLDVWIPPYYQTGRMFNRKWFLAIDEKPLKELMDLKEINWIAGGPRPMLYKIVPSKGGSAPGVAPIYSYCPNIGYEYGFPVRWVERAGGLG